MRHWLLALALAAGVTGASTARAQFANHSIGLTAGYLDYSFAGTPTGLQGGVDLGLDYSLFFEGGFDLYARSLFGIYVDGATKNVSVPIGGGLGVRYLILQEYFQPYVGVAFNFAYFTFDTPDFGSFLFGFAPYIGAQYYINQSFSIGMNIEYQLNFAPVANFPLYQGLAFMARVATHF